MVLESTIICVDNSEFMRNGDFLPTRLQAQQDAVGLITQSKLRSNPESNVGLLTLGGLEVLTTLTTDIGKILAKLHAVQPAGSLRLIQGIKIAHLVLKHRQGKNHRTRIVVFIGSPVESDEVELIKLAKKLKKEKVNVDVVNFGEDSINTDVLKKFVEIVNGRDGSGSHLVTIPSGAHLSDALVSSPVVQGEDGSGGIASTAGFEFGVDPNEDPELALALRVSMEEQRARQEAEASGAKEPVTPASAPATTVAMVPSAAAAASSSCDKKDGSFPPATGASGSFEDDAMLEKALVMSMAMDLGNMAEPDLSVMSEEEQIAYAMRMSMQDQEQPSAMEVEEAATGAATTSTPATQSNEDDYSEAISDPAFLQSVLESLPGVDPSSAAIQQAMDAMVKKGEKKDKDKEKK